MRFAAANPPVNGPWGTHRTRASVRIIAPVIFTTTCAIRYPVIAVTWLPMCCCACSPRSTRVPPTRPMTTGSATMRSRETIRTGLWIDSCSRPPSSDSSTRTCCAGTPRILPLTAATTLVRDLRLMLVRPRKCAGITAPVTRRNAYREAHPPAQSG